jgi:3-oxoacyl-[acyl-carrier protein] reductase
MTFPQRTRRFAGKTVLVTGAGTGFGAAIAVRAAQEGADVAVHYRSSEAGVGPLRAARRGRQQRG